MLFYRKQMHFSSFYLFFPFFFFPLLSTLIPSLQKEEAKQNTHISHLGYKIVVEFFE